MALAHSGDVQCDEKYASEQIATVCLASRICSLIQTTRFVPGAASQARSRTDLPEASSTAATQVAHASSTSS
ncbi:hypothetical protein CC117_27810 [Parafrankia colletiae]|uniref:Uncharacterized protein n=1 Tax=Parafrankia colletiae TaxID=573497 RepID=A0A1S1QA99_9ACTN|nr:hypothetical protein CC117_27810 [Parafrankia colletiae]